MRRSPKHGLFVSYWFRTRSAKSDRFSDEMHGNDLRWVKNLSASRSRQDSLLHFSNMGLDDWLYHCVVPAMMLKSRQRLNCIKKLQRVPKKNVSKWSFPSNLPHQRVNYIHGVQQLFAQVNLAAFDERADEIGSQATSQKQNP